MFRITVFGKQFTPVLLPAVHDLGEFGAREPVALRSLADPAAAGATRVERFDQRMRLVRDDSAARVHAPAARLGSAHKHSSPDPLEHRKCG